MAALEMADVGCWKLGLSDNVFHVDERFLSHFASKAASIIPFEDMLSLVDKADREKFRKMLLDSFKAEASGEFEIELKTQADSSHKPCWLHWKGKVEYSTAGIPVYCFGIIRNITDQVERRSLSVKELALSENIATYSADLLSRWDLNAEIIWANAAFDQKSKRSATIRKQLLTESTTDAYENVFNEFLQKAIAEKTVQHSRLSDFAGNVSMDASFIPEFGIDSQLESILVIEREIPVVSFDSLRQSEKERLLELEDLNQQLALVNEEYTAANEELAQANQLLFQSNENLKQFAYIASHDLQEPLRKVHSFGDLLRKRIADNAEGVALIERMQHASKRMSGLIEDLLTFSHVSSDQNEFGYVDLNEIFDGILSDLEESINKSGAVVTRPTLPSLKGDSRQLSQLFQNLLSNAIKFRRNNVSPEIKVSWTIVKTSNLPAHLIVPQHARAYDRIDISDNGIGFESQYKERIFKVFQRLHRKNEYEGTGIGLAICEKVIANHQGMISVESETGVGTTFSVFLPIY